MNAHSTSTDTRQDNTLETAHQKLTSEEREAMEADFKRQQRARVRRQFLRAVRDRNVEGDEMEELCGKAIDLHGGVRELARAIRDDSQTYREQHPGTRRGDTVVRRPGAVEHDC